MTNNTGRTSLPGQEPIPVNCPVKSLTVSVSYADWQALNTGHASVPASQLEALRLLSAAVKFGAEVLLKDCPSGGTGKLVVAEGKLTAIY